MYYPCETDLPEDPRFLVQIFGSSVSGNLQIKSQQKRLESILNTRKIPYIFIDVAANTAAKNYMRKVNPTPTVVLPQIFVDGTFCGFFPQFEEANDREELSHFLGFESFKVEPTRKEN